MSAYRPEEWHDFFLTVGGGAAALTGLVVVAMSMHLPAITVDPTLRHRARSTLGLLAAVFIRCSLALMGGQGGRAVAIDLLVVCLGVVAFGLYSYSPVSRSHVEHRSSLVRTTALFASNITEMLGATFLLFGYGWGMNVAAVAMMTTLGLLFSGSWLLLLGVRRDEMRAVTGPGDPRPFVARAARRPRPTDRPRH